MYVLISFKAQWGEGNNGSVAEDALSAMENFFEDDSLESNSDDSGNDDEDEDDEMMQHTDEIYKRYFGTRSQDQTIESTRSMLHRSRLTVGPSSDMLQPVVTITYPHNIAILDTQSIHLAKGWKFGKWENRETSPESKFDINMQNPPQFIQYQDINAKKEKSSFSRTMSVPNMNLSRISESDPRSDLPFRENMEESMTFLKKLFLHQQEGGITFPTTLQSPPDSPICKFSDMTLLFLFLSLSIYIHLCCCLSNNQIRLIIKFTNTQ